MNIRFFCCSCCRRWCFQDKNILSTTFIFLGFSLYSLEIVLIHYRSICHFEQMTFSGQRIWNEKKRTHKFEACDDIQAKTLSQTWLHITVLSAKLVVEKLTKMLKFPFCTITYEITISVVLWLKMKCATKWSTSLMCDLKMECEWEKKRGREKNCKVSFI